MTEASNAKTDDLPQPEEELTSEDAERVAGGMDLDGVKCGLIQKFSGGDIEGE